MELVQLLLASNEQLQEKKERPWRKVKEIGTAAKGKERRRCSFCWLARQEELGSVLKCERAWTEQEDGGAVVRNGRKGEDFWWD